MSIAYLDCASGVSGDMTLAALVDAGADLAAVQAGIDSLGLPSCRLVASAVTKRGFRATQITVEHAPEHVHRHLHHITEMIERGALTPRASQLATAVFTRLAEAEAKVHGTTIKEVHFHEVGAVDSIADIVGSAIAYDLLGIERLVAAPVPTGTGFVTIAHGRCSIPAPATGELLRGVPLSSFSVEGELTTPTGAALVTTLAERFGPLPAMTIRSIGYGPGQSDFDHPNILRLFVGEEVAGVSPIEHDTIVLLETNLDDVDGESIGYCVERLWEAGALDVCASPIQMKKGRPGVLLAVQAKPADADRLEAIIFRDTMTLGVRRQALTRHVLRRQPSEVSTEWGAIRGVVARLPDGSVRFAPEYESCRQIAAEQHLSLARVRTAAVAAFDAAAADVPSA
ncbi:MAG: nickel pincer cofactor biosynthesis protein LarC [Luteitalea sp.]|nr:nickel pincer cofactor biosynthesis protein LarC [Luteitalea sp.]